MRFFTAIAVLLTFTLFFSTGAHAEDSSLKALTSKKEIESVLKKDQQKKVVSSDKIKLYGSFTTRKYIVGPNDIINVSALGVQELTQTSLKVQPDGQIDLAGIGNIKVAGLTLSEIKDQLVEKYSYYVKNPAISVKLERSRPFIVQITGAVSIPGSYEIKTDTENGATLYNDKTTFVERKTPILSNVLIAAGGINYDADVEHILISNETEGVEYEINGLDLLENGKSAKDIYLMAGDSVHVPKLPTPLAVNQDTYKKFAGSAFANRIVPVRVIGYVNAPGLVTLDTSTSSTLNTAIAKAGGYQSSAAYPPKKVFISRVSNDGTMTTTVVNPMKNDVTLMPNDVIYVPEKIRPMIGKTFDYLTRIAAPIASVAGGYNNWALMFDPTRFDAD
ncbi:MAG TPA: polysaccharide biosynthesis/export family protein [Candidatus Gastranaerophilales bacterium]|nr:polysaccharide biosynthesis/export family protein [Candidatus Gastranaerophilales bacterium]